jgi:hypothetical protein
METVIKILPKELQGDEKSWQPKFAEDCFAPSEINKMKGFLNAKNAIHYLMQEFKIQRHDEIFIHTTSDSNYVSSCVTCTIFNYGKPSRVLSDRTKMIYVIHEFGFYDPLITELINEGKARKIPIVEDVAHSPNSFYQKKRVGTIGDFGIFSLPKFFDVELGGLLMDNSERLKKKDLKQNSILELFLKEYLYINEISLRKRIIYNMFTDQLNFSNLTYSISEDQSPFVISFDHLNAVSIIKYLNENLPKVVLFPMHVANRISIPINPFCSLEGYQNVIEHLKQFLNYDKA